MSAPNPASPQAATAKLNKVELFSDVLAFTSIVTAFLFLSFTTRYDIFGSFFGLTLSSSNQIVLFYLLYSLLILLLKSISVGTKLAKKVEETDLTKELDSAVGRSLFTVSSVVTVHILVSVGGSQLEVPELCLVSIWVLVAELNLIFCGLLKKQPIFQSLQLFGAAIEIILVGAQLAKYFIGFDFFNVL